MVRGFVSALLMFLTAYGTMISEVQNIATIGFVMAAFALLQAWFTRQAVYSPATVDQIEDEADEAIVDAYYAGVEDAESDREIVRPGI